MQDSKTYITSDWMIREIKGNIGLNYMDLQEYEKAIEYYSQEIESDPNNGELYFWRGRSYREAALAIRRANNRENTEESIIYFQKSNEDYEKARKFMPPF